MSRGADGYSGDCEVGGPAARRQLPGLTVTKLAVGAMANNAYLLDCTQTGESLLVDAPAPYAAIVAAVGDSTPVGILLTHGHHDHIAALPQLRAALGGVPVLCHSDDAGLLPIHADRLLTDGDEVVCGAATLRVIGLRGHTPGGIALLYDAGGLLAQGPHVFVGDSLFPGGVGATGGDPQRFSQLLGDVERKLFDPLPDATWIYPGHGRDTTLGAERPHLGDWRARGW